MKRSIDKLRGLLLGASVAALALSAVPGAGTLVAQETDETAQIAKGAAVYGNMCGRCHNPRSPLERDDRDWVTIITHMRVRGNLTGGQVRSVLAFLQATNSDPSRSSPIVSRPEGTARHLEATDDPISTDLTLISEGEVLLTQRACVGCHLVGGGGGNIGPSLNGITGRRDVRFLRQKLIDPTIDNTSSMMPNLGLTADEIEAILAFLATLGEEAEATGSPGR